MKFEQAFKILLDFEGGYSDEAGDPGGKTRFGVTEAVARANGYEGDMTEFPVESAQAIYRKSYWDRCRVDDLPEPIQYAVFDAAVNSGTGQSVKWLQEAVGASVDGIIGPGTIQTAKMMDPQILRSKLIGKRLGSMTKFSDWKNAGAGWANRISKILEMA